MLQNKKIKPPRKKKNKLSQDDLDFLNSLSGAVSQKVPRRSVLIVILSFLSIVWLIYWASIAKLDVITQGEGKIIPSKKVQRVSNLEGGIVEEIMVYEGQIVEKGQSLLKISDTTFKSKYQTSALKEYELVAKAARLKAEFTGKSYSVSSKFARKYKSLVANEKNLLSSERAELDQSIRVIRSKISQIKSEISEAKSKLRNLQRNYDLIKKENALKYRLYKKRLISEVEYLEIQRKINETQNEMDIIENSFPRLRSMINEQTNTISGLRLQFRNKAKKEYNEISAKIAQIKEGKVDLKDKVTRTLVKSPIKGVVQKLAINTIGGILKPGMDLVEIVPLDDKLLIETKIMPKDIAFVSLEQPAIVKPSAYDFSIYGGLDGKVVFISPDTTTDEKGNSFYIIHVRTEKNFLVDKANKELQIKVGMIAGVAIITGKKSVLEYILKPINKAKDSAFTER